MMSSPGASSDRRLLFPEAEVTRAFGGKQPSSAQPHSQQYQPSLPHFRLH